MPGAAVLPDLLAAEMTTAAGIGRASSIVDVTSGLALGHILTVVS